MDDLDKSASLDVVEAPRRSTKSLDGTGPHLEFAYAIRFRSCWICALLCPRRNGYRIEFPLRLASRPSALRVARVALGKHRLFGNECASVGDYRLFPPARRNRGQYRSPNRDSGYDSWRSRCFRPIGSVGVRDISWSICRVLFWKAQTCH